MGPLDHSEPPSQRQLCYDIVAHKCASFSADMFPALRRRPGPGLGESLPVNLLKHADEQAVAGLAAVLHALADFQLEPAELQDWGIIAAPCFLGRTTLATALEQFRQEGPWGLSPHFIPHASQHAVSGTISLALKIHGPNFGAGGGSTGLVESLLAGAVFLSDGTLPGVWVVITGWHPERIPIKTDTASSNGHCTAVAMALKTHHTGAAGPTLSVGISANLQSASQSCEPGVLDFAGLLDPLAADQSERRVSWRCQGGAWIEIRGGRAVAGLPQPHYLQRLTANRSGASSGRASVRRGARE